MPTLNGFAMFPFNTRSWVVIASGMAAGYLLYRCRGALLERARATAAQTDAIMRGPRERLAALDGAGD